MAVLILGILASFAWLVFDPGVLSGVAFGLFGFLSLIFAIWPSRATSPQ